MVLAFSQHLRRRSRRSMERNPSIRSKRNDSRFRYPAVRNIPTICTPHLPSPLLLSGRPNSGSTTRSKLTFRIPATDPKRCRCPQSRPDCHRQPIQPNQCHQKIRTKPLSSLLSDTAGDLCQTPARTAATIAQHPCERCRRLPTTSEAPTSLTASSSPTICSTND